VSALPYNSSPVHGGQLRQIAARYGIPVEQLLDFSANINPDGPPQSVLTAIRRSLESPATLASYPDLDLIELKQTIANCEGIQSENVAIANGFVPLLEAALRSLQIQGCFLPVPSFGEYRRALENAGMRITPYPLSQDREFAYEIDAILKTLSESSCDAILLANPQNPSGRLCDAKGVLHLIEGAAQCGVTVLLDEAFIDYCYLDSLIKHSGEHVNVIVFRSVTKFFSIPGLRVAYATGQPAKIEAMNRLIVPWPITSLASDAVRAALRDEAYAEESRTINARRRSWLEHELARLGIVMYPSSTNFLLLRFPASIDVSKLWERMIVEQQIVLRSCANFEGLTEGHLRIAVRSETENERLIRGLEQLLSSSAR
jgi:threonine-phosphate decarboxylase